MSKPGTTYDGVARLIAELSNDHGRVTVDREDVDGKVTLTIRARSQEPVVCTIGDDSPKAATHKKAAPKKKART
ncbi:MAG: hypothetical protein J0I48_15420 [Devosia sp.]|uniref:hypothetical protein n=1 Tax=Devosia sp. 66-22 TaxID=1895753 RepID=UPI00092B8F49|nr:hypothetical protein [Devosia sp. 66-22]MBN9347560.1 hypothetical protein [Devosia sp.]OJX50675.1 MAG: hypothetical protein BGO81_20720 [Devosia sp. 66-22]